MNRSYVADFVAIYACYEQQKFLRLTKYCTHAQIASVVTVILHYKYLPIIHIKHFAKISVEV